MSEQVSVSGQYDDLTGKVATEGFDHFTTMSLGIGCPKGFYPVGFSCYASRRNEGDPLEFQFSSFAVDESILEERGAGGVTKYARQHGQLPVFSFQRPKVTLEQLLSEIKRFHILFQDSSTERVPLMLVDEESGRSDGDFEDGDELGEE